ncbi:phage head closure protein [Delftia sp. RIT313]|uniref:phage head closure protein n=1 Tax=Delftia sp. RIT313 TaxID=1468410 RepID=UPI0004453606|nr:phage head closure protein [Delftia sp. RIT313]EZP51390.1 putative phage head-tail adaptor [Delftia sp. RIT313]
MALESGKLRHRVRIEAYTEQRDSSGEVIQNQETGEVLMTWSEVATVWAAVEPLSAREFIQSAATQSQVTARITIRQRDDLLPSMRLVHVRNGRADVIYNPAAFLEDKASGLEYMTIPCSRGVGEGQ